MTDSSHSLHIFMFHYVGVMENSIHFDWWILELCVYTNSSLDFSNEVLIKVLVLYFQCV